MALLDCGHHGASGGGEALDAPSCVLPVFQVMPSSSAQSIRTPSAAASLTSVSMRGVRAPRSQ